VRRLSGAEFDAFQGLIYQVTGIHLAPSKGDMLAVRLGRRLRALGLDSFADYYTRVTSDPSGAEREQFINAVTTNKTHFFREPHHFELLRDQVIPRVRAATSPGARRLRIWSAAASTGEEAYSAAMVAHHALAGDGCAIEIVGSDIDTDVLAHARAGIYAEEQVAETPDHLRQRYLVRDGARWRVADELRALVQFTRVNLIHDAIPYQGAFDAVFLRNVLIYFDPETRSRLIHRIRPYFAERGYLFLGHAESLLGVTDRLVSAGRTAYRPRSTRSTALRLAGGGRHGAQPIAPPIASPGASPGGSPGSSRGPAPRVERLPPGGVIVSRLPVQIDAIVGPCLTACVFDEAAHVGGMTRFGPTTGSAAEPAMARLVAQVVEAGGARGALRAKLVGGGSAARTDRAAGERDAAIAEAFLRSAGIPLVSKRVGGEARREVQFFTDSGRLLCRDAE
jgi:chemotaxis protein methyltransferase CheR